MAARFISNVFRRGKDVIRFALPKQPKTELYNLHPPQVIAPKRDIWVSYKTIASQLRQRAAFQFGRPQRLPFLGFAGLALASSTQNDNEKLTEEIRSRIKSSPIIQQLFLESFDLGQVIGNAVVFEARQKEGQEVTHEFDNSSDFENVITLQSTSVEDEEDKWYPPPEQYVEEKTSQSFSVIEETSVDSMSISTELSDGDSENTEAEEECDKWSFIEEEGIGKDLQSVHPPTEQYVEEETSQSFSVIEVTSVDSMSISTELSDGDSENTESEEECDKWSFIEEEGIGTGSIEDTTSTKYNLAIKMMFNYEVESKADSIMKAMEKETVPAKIPIYQLGDSRYFRYDMTLREYLEQHKPDVRTRCLLLTQLLEGIVHLGNHGIAHRDIKTDNMFLEISEQSVPKLVIIGDFGCCLADTEFGQKLPYFTSDTDREGNCSLMAPEISTAIPGRDIWLDYSKADLWAVGTIIYELFDMDNPFYGNQSGQGIQDSRTYREQDLPSLPDTVPYIVKLLVRLCLSRDPTKRPTPTDAANLMQIFLWLPEWFVFKPDLSGIKENLLVLTAQVILCGKHMDPGDQLMSTFLQRLKLEDIISIIDNFAEVE